MIVYLYLLLVALVCLWLCLLVSLYVCAFFFSLLMFGYVCARVMFFCVFVVFVFVSNSVSVSFIVLFCIYFCFLSLIPHRPEKMTFTLARQHLGVHYTLRLFYRRIDCVRCFH